MKKIVLVGIVIDINALCKPMTSVVTEKARRVSDGKHFT